MNTKTLKVLETLIEPRVVKAAMGQLIKNDGQQSDPSEKYIISGDSVCFRMTLAALASTYQALGIYNDYRVAYRSLHDLYAGTFNEIRHEILQARGEPDE